MRNTASIVGLFALSLAMGVAVSGRPGSQAGQSSTKQEQQPASGHQSHQDQVNERGDHVMGFDHTRTTHHFRLLADGGAIDVSVNEAADTASRDQIRHHLQHIARMFSSGDFSAPMLIHSQTPPGVEAMKSLKDEIAYKFEETERGGRVRISTSNADALKAVHEFLIFQIKDHQTGDSLEVEQQ